MRFDLDPETPQISYKLMTATVTPRPIAWITTLSPEGIANAAPYSFFNVMGHTPPTVAIGILGDPVKGWKDTSRNILDTGQFVVNMVPRALAEAMNLTCIDAPADVSELDIAGLETRPARHIAPPLIASAPVSFECKTHSVVSTSAFQAIVVGQVLAIHIDDDYVMDAENAYIDTPRLDLIGRMHGAGWYTRSTDRFQLERPDYESWRARNKPE